MIARLTKQIGRRYAQFGSTPSIFAMPLIGGVFQNTTPSGPPDAWFSAPSRGQTFSAPPRGKFFIGAKR